MSQKTICLTYHTTYIYVLTHSLSHTHTHIDMRYGESAKGTTASIRWKCTCGPSPSSNSTRAWPCEIKQILSRSLLDKSV